MAEENINPSPEVLRSDIMPELNSAIFDVHDLLICTICHRNALIYGLLHRYENPAPSTLPSVVVVTYVTCYRCCERDFALASVNRYIDDEVATTRYEHLLIKVRRALNVINLSYKNLNTPMGHTVRLIMDVLPVLSGRENVVTVGVDGLEPRMNGFLEPDLEEL